MSMSKERMDALVDRVAARALRRAQNKARTGADGRFINKRPFEPRSQLGVRPYQKTFWGWMQQKAAVLNSYANIRNRSGKVSGVELIEIWARQNGYSLDVVKCANCGRPTSEWQFDHIKPVADGGQNFADNLQILCPVCHAEKSITERAARRAAV